MTKRTTMVVVVLVLRRRRRRRKDSELTSGMCKETNFPLTILSIFTSFSSIPRGVQIAFKNTMRELTRVTSRAVSTAVLRTHLARVLKPARVTAACFLAGVSERTVSPVVAAAASASSDLELEHTEVVGGVRVVVGKHVGGGCSAGQKLPWWDVDV